jgi:hypothetical protein
MNIIISRLKNGFYIFNKSIQKDLSRIVENARKYNPENSPIIDFAEFLKKVCIKALEGDLTEKDQETFQNEFLKLSQSQTEPDEDQDQTQVLPSDQPNTKIILKKTEESLKIQPLEKPKDTFAITDPSLSKRNASTAFPGKRAPSSRLKRVMRKESKESIEVNSSEEQSLRKMINRRNRSRVRRNIINGRNQGNEVKNNVEDEVKEEMNGHAILQQIFENTEVKRESKVRTRRRMKFEQTSKE